MRKTLPIILVFAMNIAQAQPFTKKFILAFHTVETGCNNPQCHETHLAESNDGLNWSMVPDFPVYSGSVPDVVVRNNKLYLYNPGKVTRYDGVNHVWETQQQVSVLDSAGNTVNFVDPSPIVDENGNIVLFFLNSTGSMGDPAVCNPYPCTKIFDSAVEVNGSDGTQFLLQSGHRYTVTLQSGTASDPDIYYDGSNYILYISKGSNTEAYHAAALHDSYSSFQNLQNNLLTTQGGIPCGIYDETTQSYFTYVHQNQGNTTVIRAAAHADFNQQVSNFQTVMDAQIAGLDASVKCESPGICTNDFLTGIDDETGYNASFKIYPNPVSAEMMIVETNANFKEALFCITDLAGNIVLKKNISALRSEVELGGFAPGIYFACLQGRTLKFVKK